MKNKKNINWSAVVIWVAVYLMFMFFGFVLGMVYQQILTTKNIIDVLSFTDIDVEINFNTSKFVEEFNQTIIPAIRDVFNQTNNTK